MSTVTKEWLQKAISDYESARDELPFGLDDYQGKILASLRIALASLEAEPVCVIDQSNLDYLKSGSDADVWPASRTEMGDVLLYSAATPAPVSVPDENGLLPCPCCGGRAEFDYDDDNLNWISCNVCGISTDTAYHTDVDARDRLRNVWNLRTAMLQGSDGNSQVIPDGWVLVPVEPTMSQEFAGYRTLTDTGKMSRLMKTRLSNIYRAMIATAPQQEVN
ncbi:TPA: Lar family restriction alleviation protein [Enterobacter hormaechei]